MKFILLGPSQKRIYVHMITENATCEVMKLFFFSYLYKYQIKSWYLAIVWLLNYQAANVALGIHDC